MPTEIDEASLGTLQPANRQSIPLIVGNMEVKATASAPGHRRRLPLGYGVAIRTALTERICHIRRCARQLRGLCFSGSRNSTGPSHKAPARPGSGGFSLWVPQKNGAEKGDIFMSSCVLSGIGFPGGSARYRSDGWSMFPASLTTLEGPRRPRRSVWAKAQGGQ